MTGQPVAVRGCIIEMYCRAAAVFRCLASDGYGRDEGANIWLSDQYIFSELMLLLRGPAVTGAIDRFNMVEFVVHMLKFSANTLYVGSDAGTIYINMRFLH